MSHDRRGTACAAVAMAIGCLSVALVVIYVLYGTHLRQTQARLDWAARNQAHLIAALARSHTVHAPLIRDEIPTYDPDEATISVMLNAHAGNRDLGQTGEFVFAELRDSVIVFRSSRQLILGEERTSIPLAAHRAEPMRRALSGESGVMVGPDYRGETVLAAYEPLPDIQMGLVAKIDLAEVRAPFISAGIIAFIMAAVIAAIGVVVVRHIGNPLIGPPDPQTARLADDADERRNEELSLRESGDTGRTLLNAATDIIALLDARGTILDANEELGRRLGRPSGALVGRCLWDVLPPEELAVARRRRVELAFQTGKTVTFEDTYGGRWNIVTVYPIRDGHGTVARVAVIIGECTQRKQAELSTAIALDELNQVFDNAPDAMRIIDKELTVIRVNAAFLALSGLTKDEVVGRKCHETLGGPYCLTADCPLRQIVDGAEQVIMETTKTRTDATSFPCLLSLARFRDRFGNIVGAIENCRDITDRKRTEEQRARLSAIVEETSDLVFSADASGRIIYLNRAGRNMVGLGQQDDVTSLQITELHPQWAADIILSVGIPAAKRDGTWQGQTAIYGPDRQEIPVSELIIVHQSDSGDVVFMSAIMRDISAREAAELERQKLTAQLYQTDKMATIGQLAAGVAHEINNPVGFVSSNLNAMDKYLKKIAAFLGQDGSVDQAGPAGLEGVIADFGDAIAESLEGTTRIREIVADLKGFSRADDHIMQPADINAGLESTLNIVRNQLKYHCKIETDLGELPPVRCLINQVNQVFMNLLVNAGQAIKSDNGLIRIRSWADGCAVYVSVRDNGEGIPRDNLKRIFEPFYTTKEAGTGTGLGLSLSLDIIKKHGGQIEVSSTVGEGTEFVAMLPYDNGQAEAPEGERISAACVAADR
jgi:PAS domain S-box-containing protein